MREVTPGRLLAVGRECTRATVAPLAITDQATALGDTDQVTALEVAKAIRRELRSLVLAWIAICGAVGIALGATGARSSAEAAWTAAGLLPFAVPMVPMLWLHVGWGGFGVTLWYGWRPVLIVFSWSVATALPAFGVAVMIWRIGGVA